MDEQKPDAQQPEQKPNEPKPAAPASESGFFANLKNLVKTKNMDQISEKYLKPAWAQTKVAAAKTSDFIAENTPKVVAASQRGIEKAQQLISNLSKKSDASTAAKSDTPSETVQPSSPTSQINSGQSDKKTAGDSSPETGPDAGPDVSGNKPPSKKP